MAEQRSGKGPPRREATDLICERHARRHRLGADAHPWTLRPVERARSWRWWTWSMVVCEQP
jgi:hypothetical protein